jgi:hypothetical protein
MSVQIGETEIEQTANEAEPLYETAKPVTWSRVFTSWLPERFAEALLEEHDIDYELGGYRLVEIYNHLNDEEGTKVLMVDPDGTRVYIGEDPTARDSNGLYGFVIRTGDRLPAVRTVEEATNLLKPAHVSAAEAKGATPLRQGEWFLVPADTEPESKIFSGEVAERPFGSSPLENHVPTEYALGVSEPEFVDRFFEMCPQLEEHVETAKEAFARVEQAYQIASLEDVELETDIPTFDEVRELAEPIYVRGTLRHRENDHYMESIGDDWHVAVTHDVDVFTAETDDLTEDNPMRLD